MHRQIRKLHNGWWQCRWTQIQCFNVIHFHKTKKDRTITSRRRDLGALWRLYTVNDERRYKNTERFHLSINNNHMNALQLAWSPHFLGSSDHLRAIVNGIFHRSACSSVHRTSIACSQMTFLPRGKSFSRIGCNPPTALVALTETLLYRLLVLRHNRSLSILALYWLDCGYFYASLICQKGYHRSKKSVKYNGTRCAPTLWR